VVDPIPRGALWCIVVLRPDDVELGCRHHYRHILIRGQALRSATNDVLLASRSSGEVATKLLEQCNIKYLFT
jgi:hypothetical protein